MNAFELYTVLKGRFATAALKTFEMTYGEEKNASMGRKSDLYGVFGSNAVALNTEHSVKPKKEK